MAIQMDYRNGQRQDFVLQNSPIFPIWPVQGFALAVQLGIARAQGQDKEFLEQLPPDQRAMLFNLLDLVSAVPALPRGRGPDLHADAGRLSPRDLLERQGPSVGDRRRAGQIHRQTMQQQWRFMCRPRRSILPSARSDFLQVELKRHVEHPLEVEEPACFDFYLQPLEAAAMTGPDGQVLPPEQYWRWVEDTTLEWKEAEAPAYRWEDLPDRPGAATRDLRRSGQLHQLVNQHLGRA